MSIGELIYEETVKVRQHFYNCPLTRKAQRVITRRKPAGKVKIYTQKEINEYVMKMMRKGEK